MRRVHEEQAVRFVAPRLVRALARTNVRVSNPAFLHLVGVVARANQENMGRLVSGEPLFLRYESAYQWRAGSVERRVILEEVGDAGLLLSGYWWEQKDRSREPVDVDYVMRLGRLAYRCIGAEPYHELANKYSPLVDTMTVLATQYAPVVHRDRVTLALYRAWEERQVPRIARILRRLGIPVTDPAARKS